MKNALRCFVLMIALLVGSAAWATVPTPTNVKVWNPSTSSFSNHTPDYVSGGTNWERWDVAIEATTAANGTRFLLYYDDEGTEWDYAYMYCNSDMDECFQNHYSSPSVEYIRSTYYDLDWEDNQLIAYLVHDDNGTAVVIYLVVQLYTIGK